MKETKTSVIIPVTGDANVTTNPLGDCLKSTSKLTETIYINVCNGQTHTVPLGFWDGSAYVGILLLIVVIIMMILKMIFD